jgi:prepilin-type N-terminal cleavage/methylation domain-containing protein
MEVFKMTKLSKSAGFSLVELMIVVAIMAILAAIAIPSFLRFSMKAKTAEATSNLAAIRTAEESYKAENDVYLVCAGTPGAWAAGAGASTPIAWGGGGIASFTNIGFSPDGNVRYQYAVAAGSVNPIATAFSASATGDLDEDGVGNEAVYTVDKDAATYPKVIQTGDDF